MFSQNLKPNKPMNLTIPQQQELERLARAINAHQEAIGIMVRSVREKSRQALAEAILCGKALTEARGIVGYGNFCHWWQNSLPGISQRTGYRYMHVYRRDLAGELTDLDGLHAAYLLTEGGDAPGPAPAPVERADALRMTVDRLIERLKADIIAERLTLEDAVRETIARLTEWFKNPK